MRALLLLISTILAFPALAQDESTDDRAIIVITGKPLAETEAALAACLARNCPPKEDIDASLAHAENLFVAGDYESARQTLGRSRSRNQRFAKTLPVDVADLNRAYGRVANVSGQPDSSRLAQIAALDALKAGLDDSDSRILMQRLMVGDEFAQKGRLVAAEDVYRKVAKQARRAGNLRVMGHAMFHDAVVHCALASAWRQYRPLAEQKIAAIERTAEPELVEFRNAAKLLRASMAAYDRDSEALERAIASIPPQTGGKPMLIFAPPVEVEKIASGSATRIIANNDASEWIDFRFEIGADGKVRSVERLRQSGNVGGNWPEIVQRALTRRRYAPMALPAGKDGLLQVERFSYVRDQVSATGSRMPERSGSGRVTSLDLSQEEPN